MLGQWTLGFGGIRSSNSDTNGVCRDQPELPGTVLWGAASIRASSDSGVGHEPIPMTRPVCWRAWSWRSRSCPKQRHRPRVEAAHASAVERVHRLVPLPSGTRGWRRQRMFDVLHAAVQRLPNLRRLRSWPGASVRHHRWSGDSAARIAAATDEAWRSTTTSLPSQRPRSETANPIRASSAARSRKAYWSGVSSPISPVSSRFQAATAASANSRGKRTEDQLNPRGDPFSNRGKHFRIFEVSGVRLSLGHEWERTQLISGVSKLCLPPPRALRWS